jgi:hypothetical protein
MATRLTARAGAKHRTGVDVSRNQVSGKTAGGGATAMVGPGGVNGADGKCGDGVGAPADGASGTGTSAAQLA